MGTIETGIQGETLGTEGCGQFKCTDCFQKILWPADQTDWQAKNPVGGKQVNSTLVPHSCKDRHM